MNLNIIDNFLLQVAGRMGLVLTLFLISTNSYNSVDAPADRGVSYIEIWMIGTLFPVLATLFQFGMVCVHP